jgi:hypothetical protein
MSNMGTPVRHIPADDLASYFRGLLDAEAARTLEEHVAVCHACAKLLEGEARVELAMHEAVAVRHAGPARTRSLTRVARVLATVLVAAAAIAWLRAPSRPPADSPIASSPPACAGSGCGEDRGKEPIMSKKAITAAMLALSPLTPVCGCSSSPPTDAAGVAASGLAPSDFVPGPAPQGWLLAGKDPQSYAMGTDPGALHEGHAPLTLQSKHATESFGTLMTNLDAAPYRAKRLRLHGVVRSEDVRGWAGLWMRVDGSKDHRGLTFDNMYDRQINGTTEWRSYDVVLDVPAEAETIAYGVLLNGEGRLWADALQLEPVDSSVATTGEAHPWVAGPGGPGVGSSWIVAGSEPTRYDMRADPQVRHGAGPSLMLRSKGPGENGMGTLMQETDAATYRGKHAHLSAFVRTSDVKEWTGLWLRIDGQAGKSLGIDNMSDRGIQGTSDWRKYDVVLDVPSEAQAVAFGVLLVGEGQVWTDDVSLTSE